ncbi:hypothetical protein SAMN02745121_08402 [Nannocystis exedens]|uniref:IgGFc-binding protein N-terminal domain-containing protein n=1 Tax=Nannocystis exedens TaxID=54 RepID=A0A1I2I2V6_9BACT|nr:IgGFc-binding protein [Nannocystis exedens]PCC74915.1 cell motility protein [Nannocystis exedens]SFF36582.1 hypothetical protein SAMN02745121_08402 [Nannocystis exedens]
MSLPHRLCRTSLLYTCCLAACGDESSAIASANDGSSDDSTTTATNTSTDPDPGPVTTSPEIPTTGGPVGTETGTGTTTTGAPATSTTGATGTTGEPCDRGEVVCDGDVAQVCDGMGGFSDETRCPGACIAGTGCAVCEPGAATCDGEILKLCNDDGTAEHEVECDGVQGLACDADSRRCVGACAPDVLGASSLGCDFYPTVTANSVKDKFAFAVVVANAGDSPAHLEIDKGPALVLMDTVAPHSLGVFELPWDIELKAGSDVPASLMDVDGAYRLRSDAPVTVTQFSPIEFGVEPLDMAASNDASLLFPAHAWSTDYVVAAYNSVFYEAGDEKPGFYAVTASEDGTTVTLFPSATGDAVLPGAGVQADGTGQVVLDRGDVLEVFSQRTGQNPSTADVTGTRITADKPIQVIGGHVCTQVPHSLKACDHLEESMLPVDALAEQYVVTAPRSTLAGLPRHQMVRIIATEANTQLGYDPPQPGAPTTIAEAGDYAEIAATDQDFMITASAKVVVAQYMRSQKAGGGLGDPSLLLAVPPERFRDSYLFHTPSGFEGTFVGIVAPLGAEVTLDGLVVADFEPIGATQYGVARVELTANPAGQHEVAADVPVGVSVYGTGFCTSYWYPAGVELGS